MQKIFIDVRLQNDTLFKKAWALIASTPTGQSTLRQLRELVVFHTIITPRSRLSKLDSTEVVWTQDDAASANKNMTTRIFFEQNAAIIHVDSIRKYWKKPGIRKQYRKHGHRRVTVLAASLHHEMRHVVAQYYQYVEIMEALSEAISDGDFTKEEQDQMWTPLKDPTHLDRRYLSGLPGEEQWISDDPVHQQFLTELRQLYQNNSWLRKFQKAITLGPMRPEDEKVFEWLREQRESATGPEYLQDNNTPGPPVARYGGSNTQPPRPAPSEIPEFIRKAQEKVFEDLRRIREENQNVTRQPPSAPALPDSVDIKDPSGTASPSAFPDPIVTAPGPTTGPSRQTVKQPVVPLPAPAPEPDKVAPLPTAPPPKKEDPANRKHRQDQDDSASSGSSKEKDTPDDGANKSRGTKEEYQVPRGTFRVDEELTYTILESPYRAPGDTSPRRLPRTVKGRLITDPETEARYIQTRDERIEIKDDELVITGDPMINWED